MKSTNSFGDSNHEPSYAHLDHIEAAHQTRGRVISGRVPLQPHPPKVSPPAPRPTARNSYQSLTPTGRHAYSLSDPSRPHPRDSVVHTRRPQHHSPTYPPRHEHGFSITPKASSKDPYSIGNELSLVKRKTRTTPIRNSDGVLIRKDGRPGLRSVTSANNLRKIHENKEAVEVQIESCPPTSGQSFVPRNSLSLSGEEGEEYTEMYSKTERGRSEVRNGAS